MNYSNIVEIYGSEVLEEIEKNKEEFNQNIQYLFQLGFDDVYDMAEREPLLFLYDSITFKNKINNLIAKIGPDYVYEIENDISLLEELL